MSSSTSRGYGHGVVAGVAIEFEFSVDFRVVDAVAAKAALPAGHNGDADIERCLAARVGRFIGLACKQLQRIEDLEDRAVLDAAVGASVVVTGVVVDRVATGRGGVDGVVLAALPAGVASRANLYDRATNAGARFLNGFDLDELMKT